MSAMCEKNLRNLDFFAIFQGFEENGVICGHMGLIFYSWSEMGPDAAIFCSYFGVISLSGFGQFYVFFPPPKISVSAAPEVALFALGWRFGALASAHKERT